MTKLVTFPGLGLSFELNRTAFQIFGISVYWYGIIITFGLILAVALCCRWAPRYGANTDQIIDLMLFAVPAALVAIRAYYVIFNLDLYRDADGALMWSRVFNFRDGGLAIYGAIISSALVLLIFCRVRKLSFLAYADLGVHGLFIGQLVGRWGNFMNVEAYGSVTDMPWRMCADSIGTELLSKGAVTAEEYASILTGELGVHPTFFYESAWNLVGLILVYIIGRKFRRYDGQCFLFYLFWYGLGRFWIEGLRTDSLYFFGLTFMGSPIRTSQMVALLSAVVAGVLLFYNWKFRKHEPGDLFVRKLAEQNMAEQTAEEPETSEEEVP